MKKKKEKTRNIVIIEFKIKLEKEIMLKKKEVI